MLLNEPTDCNLLPTLALSVIKLGFHRIKERFFSIKCPLHHLFFLFAASLNLLLLLLDFVLTQNDSLQEVDLHVSCFATSLRTHGSCCLPSSEGTVDCPTHIHDGSGSSCLMLLTPLQLLLLRWLIVYELLALYISNDLAFKSCRTCGRLSLSPMIHSLRLEQLFVVRLYLGLGLLLLLGETMHGSRFALV